VRAQAGGAGTILNNLSALGIGEIYPIGFAGADGEGFELWNALQKLPGVRLEGMIQTSSRRTFTYCKPLLMWKDKPPQELNRLDSKNWTPTPRKLQDELVARLKDLQHRLDGLIVLDQVDLAETGVITTALLTSIRTAAQTLPRLRILADSRRGLRNFPSVMFKMNAAELGALTGSTNALDLTGVKQTASNVARANGKEVFVTLAEQGIVAASPESEIEHVPGLPVRGEIDVVGAGDAVSANLVATLCAGAALREAVEIANAAGSIVIHKLGTTGTATPGELESLLFSQGL
jgi:bifunctional ADP-heptose synthase (sugar kinase/adenylyltransferase)